MRKIIVHYSSVNSEEELNMINEVAVSVAYGVFVGGGALMIAWCIARVLCKGLMVLVRKFNAWDADKE